MIGSQHPCGRVFASFRSSPRRWLVPATALFCAGAAFAQVVGARAELPQVKVGDHWKFETRDKLTGAVQGTPDYVVTASSDTQIDLRVGRNGKAVWTPELTALDSTRLSWEPGYRWLNFPLEVGKVWDFKTQWQRKDGSGSGRSQMDMVVKGYEKVSVRAGEFDAYRIEGTGFMNVEGTAIGNWNTRIVVKYWYAPAVRATVRFEWEEKSNRTVTELIEAQLAP